MIFGEVPVTEAAGAILAHSLRVEGISLKKGTLIAAEHQTALIAAGIAKVVVARLAADDVPENPAAEQLAAAIAGDGVRVEAPFTGRSNLFATAAGLLQLDEASIDAINAVDEAITVATLPASAVVGVGTMVATVKIIPYAVPRPQLDHALSAIQAPLRVQPFRQTRFGYIATRTSALKPSVLAKTRDVTQGRLSALGATITAEADIPHREEPLAAALAGMVDAVDALIVFGATAIADRCDVVPAALVAAGGTVARLGMPVDPGNLLLIGTLRDKPVIGAPGCARSPKENGFDWVLQRIVAGMPVTDADLRAMGIGGLLMEIGTRPQPRLGGRGA